MMFMCEQGGSWSPLGAAELYVEGSCCWRCVALTSLMILGHFPVSPDQQVMGSVDVPSLRVECSEGAAVGSVDSVDVPRDAEEGCCSIWLLRQRFSG